MALNLILETEMWMREFAGELRLLKERNLAAFSNYQQGKKKIDYLKTLMTRAPL